jgi:predicted Zn-dependent protease
MSTLAHMEREASITIRIDKALRETLAAIQAHFGMPVSEQVRRALKQWIESGDGRDLAKKATAKKSK